MRNDKMKPAIEYLESKGIKVDVCFNFATCRDEHWRMSIVEVGAGRNVAWFNFDIPRKVMAVSARPDAAYGFGRLVEVYRETPERVSSIVEYIGEDTFKHLLDL